MAEKKSRLTLVELNKADIAKGRHVLIVESPESRRAVSLNANVFSIGRHPHNDLALGDRLVSRHHATVAWMKYSQGADIDYSYWLIDGKGKRKRSRNGIYVNGKKKTLHRLTSGDTIKIGDNIRITYSYITYSTNTNYIFNHCNDAKVPLKTINRKSYKDTVVIDNSFSRNNFSEDSNIIEGAIIKNNFAEDNSMVEETIVKPED